MLYFRGCVAREKEKSISKATETILKKSGVSFETFSHENCCGSVLLRTGFSEEAREQMEKNLPYLKGKKILVSCAGCYKTFKNDYKEILGIELDVIHTSQLFRDLITENKLILKKSTKSNKKSLIKVTYHDPCHLGRHSGEYEAPREVLENICSLIEMEHIMENSRCCGSGGGVKSAYPEIAETIAQERVKEAENTGSYVLVTSCPFCKLNLDQSDVLDVYDLSEFLLKILGDK